MSNAGGSSGGSGGDAEEYERRMNEAMNAYMNHEMERYMLRVEQQAIPRPPRVIHRRAVIDRDHVAAHQRLYDDYFSENPRFPANMFRRRFRMRRELFMRIVSALERRYLCFRFLHDAVGRPVKSARRQSGRWPTEARQTCGMSTSTSVRRQPWNV